MEITVRRTLFLLRAGCPDARAPLAENPRVRGTSGQPDLHGRVQPWLKGVELASLKEGPGRSQAVSAGTMLGALAAQASVL